MAGRIDSAFGVFDTGGVDGRSRHAKPGFDARQVANSASLEQPDTVADIESFRVVVQVVIAPMTAPANADFTVNVNGTPVAHASRANFAGGTVTIESDLLPPPRELSFVNVGSNLVTVTSNITTTLDAGSFRVIESAEPGELSAVSTLTANRQTIHRGNFVKLTATHRTSTDRDPVSGTLVVNRVFDDGTEQTLLTTGVLSTPEEKEEVFSVRLNQIGQAELCAFITDRERHEVFVP